MSERGQPGQFGQPSQPRLDLGRLGLVVDGRSCASRGEPSRAPRRVAAGRSRRRAVCAVCRARGAALRPRSIVEADAAHRLCLRCYRAEADRHRLALARLRRGIRTLRADVDVEPDLELWVD